MNQDIVKWIKKNFESRKDVRILLKLYPDELDLAFPCKYIKHDLESCKQESLRYETRNQWKKNNNKSYDYARSHNLLEECCKHMKPSFSAKKRIKCSNGKIYNSLSEASRQLKLNVSSISFVLRDKYKQTGSYTFKYIK